MTQLDDDRVDPSDPRFRAAVAGIASTYFSEADIDTRRRVAKELADAGWESAARWLRRRTDEIEAGLPGRNRG